MSIRAFLDRWLRAGLPFPTTVRPERAATWHAVSEPFELTVIDLGSFTELELQSTTTHAAAANA